MKNDTLEAEGYELIREYEDQIAVLNTETGLYELWVESSNFAGFKLIHEGEDYEFVRSISYTKAHGRCDSCVVMTVNGTIIHERGCPRAKEDDNA